MITLKELAGLAGVSISTVSKALRGESDIGQETQERIRELAEQQGYRRVIRKRAREKAEGLTIAMIYSDIVSRYYSRLLAQFDDGVTEKGGILLSSCARFETRRMVELCEYFDRSGAVDGLICVSPVNVLGEIPKPALPMVGISYPNTESHPFDCLSVDDGLGIEEAICCFQQNGHSKIAFIGETFTEHRRQFFVDSMRRHGLSVPEQYLYVSKERFEQAGYEGMRQLLAGGNAPTAVLAAYDDIALGAAHAAHEAGLRIPEDLSIAGIDNTMISIEDNKILASVNCHMEEQVEITLGLLTKKIQEPEFTAVQNVNLRTEFVPRSTVGPAPQN